MSAISKNKTVPVLFVLFFGMVAYFLISSCRKNEYKNIDCNKISAKYSSDIFPLVSAKCNSSGCHATGSSRGDFTTYQGLKAKADNGTLEKTVLVNKTMPPSGALSQDDRNKIKCWLNNGAPNN